MCPMVSHRNRLSIPLSLIIHTPWTNRVHIPPVCLRLRIYQRVPINLRSRCKQKACILFLCQPQQIVSAQGTDLQCLDGQVKVVYGGCRACEMEYVIDLVPKIYRFCDIMLKVREFIRIYMLGISCIARYQVIYTYNLMSIFEKQITKV